MHLPKAAAITVITHTTKSWPIVSSASSSSSWEGFCSTCIIGSPTRTQMTRHFS
jgi:hypothetical protein